MEELEQGMNAVKRVTERVNEEKRLEENREVKADLVDKIVDLKVHSLVQFNPLPLRTRRI